MGKIVAIGGGELRLGETLVIDKFIVDFSGKNRPKTLFIPTASKDNKGYVEVFNKVYKDELGCDTDVLALLEGEYEDSVIEEKILSADIIYVGGGNTAMMIDVWERNNVVTYLKKAYEKGTVLSGLSAGAICWFKYGHSDSNRFDGNDEWDFIITKGIGLIDAAFCPHYNEAGRNSFDKMLKTVNLRGIASENNSAVVIEDNKYKIIKSNAEAKVYLLDAKDDKVNKTVLNNKNYIPLDMLL